MPLSQANLACGVPGVNRLLLFSYIVDFNMTIPFNLVAFDSGIFV